MRNERDLNTDFFFIRSRTESVSGTGLNGDRDRRRPIFMDRRSRSGPVDRSSVRLCDFRTVRKSVSPISLLRDGRFFCLPLRFILLHHRLLSPSLSPCPCASRRFHLRLRRSLILAIFFPPTLRSSPSLSSFPPFSAKASQSRARGRNSLTRRENFFRRRLPFHLFFFTFSSLFAHLLLSLSRHLARKNFSRAGNFSHQREKSSLSCTLSLFSLFPL